MQKLILLMIKLRTKIIIYFIYSQCKKIVTFFFKLRNNLEKTFLVFQVFLDFLACALKILWIVLQRFLLIRQMLWQFLQNAKTDLEILS